MEKQKYVMGIYAYLSLFFHCMYVLIFVRERSVKWGEGILIYFKHRGVLRTQTSI